MRLCDKQICRQNVEHLSSVWLELVKKSEHCTRTIKMAAFLKWNKNDLLQGTFLPDIKEFEQQYLYR